MDVAPSSRQTASMMIPSQTELVLVRDVLSALLHGTIAGLAPPWTLGLIESRWGPPECSEARGAADELVFSRLHCNVWCRAGVVEHLKLATWLSPAELAAPAVLAAFSAAERSWIASMLHGPEAFAAQCLTHGIGRCARNNALVEAVGPLEGFVVVEAPHPGCEDGASFVTILVVCDPEQRRSVR